MDFSIVYSLENKYPPPETNIYLCRQNALLSTESKEITEYGSHLERTTRITKVKLTDVNFADLNVFVISSCNLLTLVCVYRISM